MFRPWENKEPEKYKGQWKHPDDDPLMSSAKDFETFQESTIWQDMAMLIKDRIDMLTGMLIHEEDAKKITDLQSEIRTLQDMLILPEYLEERVNLEKGDPDAEN